VNQEAIARGWAATPCEKKNIMLTEKHNENGASPRNVLKIWLKAGFTNKNIQQTDNKQISR
jgi:hypothetical protein